MSAADAILVESSLKLSGLACSPPRRPGGAVISDGLLFLQKRPGYPGCPGAAIMITVLGPNLLGDGLRDVLDPTLRGEGEEAVR